MAMHELQQNHERLEWVAVLEGSLDCTVIAHGAKGYLLSSGGEKLLMASQENEALQLLRAALNNPHGTASERRQRLLAAWTFLRRSAAPNSALDGIAFLVQSVSNAFSKIQHNLEHAWSIVVVEFLFEHLLSSYFYCHLTWFYFSHAYSSVCDRYQFRN